MPTQGTQVYWHNLPEKQPPWRNAAELRTIIQESQQAATAATLPNQWNSGAPQRRKKVHFLTKEKKERLAAVRQRAAMLTALEKPSISQRVVPEPHATPLQIVNLIMTHLGQPLVSTAEADAAVDRVISHYSVLTQQSQSQRGLAGASQQEAQAGSRRRSGGTTRRYDPVSHATASVLSQSQSADLLGSSQPTSVVSASQLGASSSSQPAAPLQRRGTGLVTDMQDSLILNVMEELCNNSIGGTSGSGFHNSNKHNHGGRRTLRFKRLTRADLGSMKYQVTSLDAVPHRRVVLLADRRDPYFVVLFGVERGRKPEPYVEAMLKMDGRTPEELERYRRTEQPFTQVFCVAPAPVPWRRVWRSISISTYRNEFAVAIIEVDHSNRNASEAAGESESGSVAVSSDEEGEMRDTRNAGGAERSKRGRVSFAERTADEVRASSAFKVSAKGFEAHKRPRHTEDLLGACDGDESDNSSEEDVLQPGLSHVAKDMSDRASMERKWIKDAPMFDGHLPAVPPAFGDDNPIRDVSDYGGRAGELDPLQRLPRTDARDRMANAKQRVWYRRLLSPAKAAEVMERLRSMHHEDLE